MLTEEITQKAKELGLAIAESEEVKNLIASQEAIAYDPDASTLIEDYNDLQIDYRGANQMGDQEKMKELRQKMIEKWDIMGKNVAISKYHKAKTELDKLIGKVNNIITYYMSGGVEGSADGEDYPDDEHTHGDGCGCC